MLSQKDKSMLEGYGLAAEMIAKAFGSHCEVLLHTLNDVSLSVTKIINGHVTGRKVGAPLTDLGVEILKNEGTLESDVVGPYHVELDDGRKLRCVTMLIRNDRSKPIGMLCINIDLSAPLIDFLTEFSPSGQETSPKIVEHFAVTPKDMISRTLGMVKSSVDNQRKVSPSEKNKMIVMELYRKGIFSVRGAIDMVAEEMGLSRYTIYNYIREAKLAEGK